MSETVNPNARAYTVSRLNSYIREMFDYDALLNGLFVEGEISNFKAHSAGHLYFTVKDERAAMRAVMFREQAQGLTFAPRDGMKAIIYGSITVYEKTGQYQLYAELMNPLGQGGLRLAFERLKQRLEAEGLFDYSRKRPLPAAPRCIALVTAPEGAAVRDMCNVALRRDKTIRIVVSPTPVQGAGAAERIAEAIALVNDWSLTDGRGGADIIIVGRGGGGAEDLQAFNEETTARAIAASRIPTVSAVGHETDVTIADFAADLRAPTPSAAAELAVPERAAADERAARLMMAADMAVNRLLAQSREFVIASRNEVNRAMAYRLQAARLRLIHGADGLEKVSPMAVMRRGYGAVSKGGAAVRGVGQLAAGDEIELRLSDGRAHAQVLEVAYGGAEN